MLNVKIVKNKWEKVSAGYIVGTESKGATFFRKGQSKTKKEQMLENKQKIAKSFTIFEKGTVMHATVATTIATIATAQTPFKKT